MGFKELENIVNAHVKSYKSDFYDYDVPTLNHPEEQYYVWIVRTHGTHLIPKSLAASNDTLHYWIENTTDSENSVNYYEINTVTMDVTYIPNIEEYVQQCKEEAEIKEMFSYQYDYDDYDLDY